VTEHRELPRIGTGDRRPETVAPEALVPTPLRELVWRKPSRTIGYRRIALGLAAVLGLGCTGWLAVLSGFSWLSRQSPYQLPFKRIQLVPPPPPWFRGGADALLESIRERAGEAETLPILELKPERVRIAFLQSQWVERIVRVSFPPRGLRVELSYRQPVARVRVTTANEEYLLDEAGIILSWDDVDLDLLGPIILITGQRLSAPLDARVGVAWKSPAGVHDVSVGTERIRSAARLAGFLARKMRALGASRPAALDIHEINPMDTNPRSFTDPRPRGLFIFNTAHHCFRWGEPPGEESPQDLSAEEKWAVLCDWSQGTQDGRLPGGDFWDFSPKGLVHVKTEWSPQDQSSHPPSHHESSSGR
jgi:hypothetical protein